MLKKLLKYDLLYLFKKTFYCFIVALGLSILLLIVRNLPDFDFINIVQGSTMFLFVVCLIAFPIFGLIISITRYNKNMLSDEGYLTHTLPVKKSSLLLSKLISNFIFLAAIILTIVLSIFLAYADFNLFGRFINEIEEMFDVVITTGIEVVLLILLILNIIVYVALYTVLFPMCQTLAAMNDNKKGLMTVIYVVLSLVAIQFANNITQYIVLKIFEGTSLVAYEVALLSVYLIVNIAVIVLMYLATLSLLKKRLNLK